ncbi:MAG: nucleotidyl transferase AbiEii/AbiGii toxin family protein [Candidatus Omnitrophica bacterium]|nr:nucleotidyl transferase AbiEii/AbiGii toxin family protein [Candidatus Omnitrophota bacterium]
MSSDYLHNHAEFSELIRAVEHQKNIDSSLVEKDYWIMHCLYGLQKAGFKFELKGGTSLSKGYQIIHRFSEDIDIRIEPLDGMDVKTGKNQTKSAHCDSRRKYYDWLASEINIEGINKVNRDTMFDNEKTYFSGGIRLYYESVFSALKGVKEGVLLEAGFDDVAPNEPVDISSWAFDFAQTKGLKIKDNRACSVLCYHPGYTLVEKLQTIVTKFRRQQEQGDIPSNFLRHYYDVACLLRNPTVQKFIKMPAYEEHKKKRFSSMDNKIPLFEQEAFLLKDATIRKQYESEYKKSAALYYEGQIPFEEIMDIILKNLKRL